MKNLTFASAFFNAEQSPKGSFVREVAEIFGLVNGKNIPRSFQTT
jgi:hypothetical protein